MWVMQSWRGKLELNHCRSLRLAGSGKSSLLNILANRVKNTGADAFIYIWMSSFHSFHLFPYVHLVEYGGQVKINGHIVQDGSDVGVSFDRISAFVQVLGSWSWVWVCVSCRVVRAVSCRLCLCLCSCSSWFVSLCVCVCVFVFVFCVCVCVFVFVCLCLCVTPGSTLILTLTLALTLTPTLTQHQP